ncbi:MAG: MobC family plasmid mobilization relaxosome protein [Clostridiales bacterium]|nr:MobC family plasmid mobilization relaxosome protein [Clostridiales bacterium]
MPLPREVINIKRNHNATLRLSDEEYRALAEMAKRAGVSHSTLLRKLIMGKEIKERPNVDFIDLRQSIDHIGININQIAHWANANGGITPEQFEEAKKLLAEVKWIIKGWAKKWL